MVLLSICHSYKKGGGDRSPPPRGSSRLPGWFRPDRICAHPIDELYLALLRDLVAPLVEEAADRLLVPELVVLVPMRALLRQACALPAPTERLYLAVLFPGRRRLAELARVVCEGLVSLLAPRLAPFLFLVDRQRKLWPPRLVKLDPSIPVELEAEGREDLVDLVADLAALIVVDRRETVFILRVELTEVVPASLIAALFQRPSISPLLFNAQPSKSSEAEAGRAVATSRSRNSGTIDTLM